MTVARPTPIAAGARRNQHQRELTGWLVRHRATDIRRSRSPSALHRLEGVGRGYHDHVLLSGVALECKGKMPDRPADSNAVEAEAYLSSGVDAGAVDLAQILEQLLAVTPEAAARV
jgi:hypothetical protein